ncbi:UBP-type zinc finger domain-containing protein [Kitasatospora sp. NBC_01287]|uniref:UBP-type zinc finger domain-containing protein n=1 Tax=Kitasatospora sp. NBC_01287 TaxID=2903573 RepID=UPI0022539F74|nr:UBP-type zinc finger domain-containing protein [Kitasatospora sp. NBC_01287]MCX4744081.1 UBP-type zinc finger domain-containing protein [Kitasatospora sp. NBC_01287]
MSGWRVAPDAGRPEGLGCAHLDTAVPGVRPVTPQGCEECLAAGTGWVHLRMCLVCGHVGCCDSSPGQHASEHFAHQDHPLARSIEPGEDWAWCYRDELFLEPVRG